MKKLEDIIDHSIDNSYIKGIVVSLHSDDRSFIYAKGNISTEQQYFIASTTKLYVSAIFLKLAEMGKLQLDDPIIDYISPVLLSGIHQYKGIDYSAKITLHNLLSQTSGLPDYFLGKRKNGRSLQDEILAGNDQTWNLERVLLDISQMKPPFPPGWKNRALYSDTNYQILGRILENIYGCSLTDVFKKEIFEPLGFRHTYLYTDVSNDTPQPLNYKKNVLNIPKAMASFGADGGIVSTVEESMIFIKAFINGFFFSDRTLKSIQVWKRIFFPLQYGIGIARFKLPRIFSPFKPFPELIGHSGLSGAFAFYCPSKNTYLTGTVNQIAKPGTSFKLMLKLLNAW